MNIVLLEPEDVQSDTWSIHSKRQLQHLREHLDITVGQNLKLVFVTAPVISLKLFR